MNITEIRAQEKKLKKKSIRRARFVITICGLACAFMMILQIACGLFFPRVENEALSMLLDMAMFVIYLGVPFGLAELILSIKRNKELYVKRESSTPKFPPLYVAGAIGTGYIVNLIVNLCFGSWVEKYSVESSMPSSGIALFLLFIFQSVFPAILEEFAFRGVILKNILPYNRTAAIIISSLMFGIAHIDPPRIIFASIFGMVLGICYEKTGSLKIPMLIHFVNNAIATISSISAINPFLSIVFAAISYVTLLLLGCGVAAIIIYSILGISKKKYSINKPKISTYRLSFGKCINVSLLNVGIVIYLIVFAFYFSLVF